MTTFPSKGDRAPRAFNLNKKAATGKKTSQMYDDIERKGNGSKSRSSNYFLRFPNLDGHNQISVNRETARDKEPKVKDLRRSFGPEPRADYSLRSHTSRGPRTSRKTCIEEMEEDEISFAY